MSGSTLFLLVCPFLVLMLVYGVVAVVALCQAKPEDIPSVVRELAMTFRRLGAMLPGLPPRQRLDRVTQDEENGNDTLRQEEA